jgi:hypothetical protein
MAAAEFQDRCLAGTIKIAGTKWKGLLVPEPQKWMVTHQPPSSSNNR